MSTTAADQFLNVEGRANAGGDPEIRRDRFGRPLVTPPDGGEAVAYTRCTTFVDCLEDKYNLQKWSQRMVAAGLAQRPDLLLRASSLGVVEPDDPDEAKRWKRGLDEVCSAASEAASSSAKATIGTALHALTERIDRNQLLGVVPDQYRPHLDAYREATKKFRPVIIEKFVVQDEYRIGGTPDRVVEVEGEDGLFIADVKTGSVKWGLLKMAMQLAVYSRSQLYDIDTGTRSSMGPVNQDRGLIIALDAKEGTCQVLWIDLDAGWRAVQLAAHVREARTWKRLTEPMVQVKAQFPLTTDEVATALGATVIADDATGAALRVAIGHADNAEQLYELWRAAGPRWTDEHTALAAARKAVIAADHKG